MGPQLVKKFRPRFREPEGSLPYQEETASCPRPEPVESDPRRPIIRFKVTFKIIWSSELSLPFALPHQNVVCLFILPHVRRTPRPLLASYHLNNI